MYSPIRACIYCLLRQSIWRKDYCGEEWFDILTPRGRILSRAPRSVCHRGPFLLHAVVHLHLISPDGRIYLQKRSSRKKIQPGKWDTSVGGHIDSGETMESALFRETREELGIEEFSPRPLKTYRWESEQEVEQVNSHWALWEGPEPRFDPEEIDEGRWWTADEIEDQLDKDTFTPNFCWEWREILRKGPLQRFFVQSSEA